MADRSHENVPRGDHVPGGPNDASAAEMNQKASRPEPGADPAPNRGERGHDREEDDDQPQ